MTPLDLSLSIPGEFRCRVEVGNASAKGLFIEYHGLSGIQTTANSGGPELKDRK